MAYAIFLYDGVEPIDVGATFGVLSMARRLAPDLTYFGVARRKGRVTCANGLIVEAEHDFESCPQADDLVVTGGPGWVESGKDPETLAFLRAMSAAEVRISAICTGAMILEAAGLLDGRAATTKREVFAGETPPLDQLSKASGVEGRTAALVESGGVLTSGGVTLGIDAMFRLLARSHGDALAKDVARVMEYGRALEANRSALGYETSAG